MKIIFLALMATFSILALSGCLASSTSPDGVNCDYTKGKAMWEMPLDCQGGR